MEIIQNWSGKLTRGQSREMAAKVSIDEDKFREETVKALTRQQLGILNFAYSTIKKGGTLELTWKKHIITNNVKFLLGSVTLSPCHDGGAATLLDFAVSSLEQSQQEIDDLRKENTRLSSEHQGALSRLDKCANLQEDIEKGKFIVVLNNKIRRLMEQLSTVSEQLKSLQELSKAIPPRTLTKNKKENESGPGDKSPYETDDEMAHSPSPLATEQQPHTSPSPNTIISSMPGPRMDSLLSDPNEKTISSPPVRRRKRNRLQVEVRTTSSESITKNSEDSMELESDDLLQLM